MIGFKVLEKNTDNQFMKDTRLTELLFFQVTELLVKHGATVNVSDLWKFTPLHEAAAKGICCYDLDIDDLVRII